MGFKMRVLDWGKRLIFLLFIFLLNKEFVFSQKFDSCYFKKDSALLPYLLLKPLNPDSSQNYPLLVFLHGSGSRGNSNQYTAAHIDSLLLADSNRIAFPAYVVVPQCENDHKWVDADWSVLAHDQPEQPSKYMALFIQLLDSLESVLNIDKKRIYISGLSMGGFGTWDLIARLPNKFAAAAPVCGGGDVKTASMIAHIPIWCFHGTEDKAVKVSRSRDMVEALKKVNGNIKYSEYKGVGHGSWKQAYAEPDFLKWLFSKKLN
jgi:predicted peptidase